MKGTAADRLIGAGSRRPGFRLALRKDSPEPRSIQPPEMGAVVAVPQVGGLHHRCERRAA
jgi:hypothetical protein